MLPKLVKNLIIEEDHILSKTTSSYGGEGNVFNFNN